MVGSPDTVRGHFDGRRFINANGKQPKGLRSVLKWLLTSKRERWPKYIDDPLFPPPPKPEPGHAAVTFVGHSTFLIQTERCNFLTDPIFSERASPVSFVGPKRVRRPGLALDSLPKIDVVFVSHNHYDHMDLRTLSQLETRHRPVFVTSLGNRDFLLKHGLRKVHELNWWQELPLEHGVQITATPGQHFSGRGLFDRNRTLWEGYLIDVRPLKIWFAGDSAYCTQLAEVGERLGPVDLALIPIGAYRPRWFMGDVHMDPAGAVQTHIDARARQSFGMHFGTFPLAEEGIDEPVADLARSAEVAGLRRDEFSVLGFGESRIVPAYDEAAV